MGTFDSLGEFDALGEYDGLDEPDNLEPETDFIPFRPVAGHPEITDTESYVDHILDEELSRCSSSSVRRTSGKHLHMIQGGTRVRRRAEASDTGGTYAGKHFAIPRAYGA